MCNFKYVCLIMLFIFLYSYIAEGTSSKAGTASAEKKKNVPNNACIIARNGVPLFRIVIPKNPPLMTRYAGKELSDYLEQVIGCRVPVVNEENSAWFPGPGIVNIFLGKQKFTKRFIDFKILKPDEYKIIVRKGWIIIAGNDYHGEPPKRRNIFYRNEYDPATGLAKRGETGTLFGVYDFLRKHCGIEWYMPGSEGEIVPITPNLSIPCGVESNNPHYIVRIDVSGNLNIDPEYAKWYRRIGLGCVNDIDINHGLHLFRYDKNHPEFFSLKADGTRDNSPNLGINGFCLTNKEFRKILIQDIRKKFDANPELSCISIMPGDHQGPPPNKHYCCCKACMSFYDSKYPKLQSMSNYVWSFVNDVAKEVYKTHPNKLISCCAYNFFFLPPDIKGKMSPNIAVGMVINFTRYSWSKEYRKKVNTVRDFWGKYTKNLYIWGHRVSWQLNTAYGMPYFGWQTDSKLIKDFADCANRLFLQFNNRYYVANSILNCKRTTDRGYNHLPLFMLARLLWNPQLDPDTLFNEYLNRFYGPAAGSMKKFFLRCDEIWLKGNQQIKETSHGVEQYQELKIGTMPWQIYTTEVISELMGYLKRAEEAVNGIHEKRVAIIKHDIGDLVQLQRKMIDLKVGEKYQCQAKFASQTPLLDGKLNDQCWKQAKWLKLKECNTADYLNYANASAAVCWDSKNLYVAFISVNPAISTPAKYKFKNPEYNAPGFELDIAKESSGTVSRIFWTDSSNILTTRILHADTNKFGSKKIKWMSKPEFKLIKSDGQVLLEAAIPFVELDIFVKENNAFRINFGRRQKLRYNTKWRAFDILSWVPVSPVRNWINCGSMHKELGIIKLVK